MFKMCIFHVFAANFFNKNFFHKFYRGGKGGKQYTDPQN